LKKMNERKENIMLTIAWSLIEAISPSMKLPTGKEMEGPRLELGC